MIPKAATKATLEINSASIWNSVYIVSRQHENNKFCLVLNGTSHEVTIDDGLYDVDLLGTTIKRELFKLGVPMDTLGFQADTATQKVIIVFGTAGAQVDFSVNNSCSLIMGFEKALYPTDPTTEASYITAPHVAKFNSIDYYLLGCDLAGMGIGIGGNYRSIIGKVLITAPIGHQTVYQPTHPMRIPIYSRIGDSISSISAWITDQKGNSLELPDHWSMDLIIRYTL